MAGIRYRPDIDGLRAVAVLSVLLYHAGFKSFGGGFVGVDVFFVISGYLITSLIVADMEKGTFSLAGFWERRVRRILPPLITVAVATMAAAFFLFLPVDFVMLGKQAASQAVFSPNILFYKQAGYFDSASELKPLLHTWSLAVEEQFYFFFPLAMVAIARSGAGRFLKFMIPAAVLSFILCALWVYRSQEAAFYLLPFRAWELLLGSVAALRPLRQVSKPWIGEILAGGGLMMILLAVFLYDQDTLFPGIAALLPCAGTGLLLWVNGNRMSFAGRILSLKPLIGIGLVSYSWYLWHWPLMVFARYTPLVEFTAVIGMACLLASLVLAVMTYFWIERPVRSGRVFVTRRSAFRAAACSLALLAICGLFMIASDGVPGRLDPAVVRYAAGTEDINPHREDCDKPELAAIRESRLCQTLADQTIKPDFILWGDSQADALAPAFYSLSKTYGRNGYVVTAHGCPPILGLARKNLTSRFNCQQANEEVFNLIKREKIKHVFLVASWSSWLHSDKMSFPETGWYEDYKGSYNDIIPAGLRRTVDLLQEEGVQVYIMLDTPSAPFDPPRLLALETLYGVSDSKAVIRAESHRAGLLNNIQAFVNSAGDDGVIYLDPATRVCDGAECLVADAGQSLYYNSGHYSAFGALYLSPLIEPYFTR